MGNKEYYDALAPHYEAATNKPGAWLPNVYARKRLELLIKNQPQLALDLGAGTGQTTELIHDLYPDTAITAVDFSELMLKVLEARGLKVNVIKSDINDFVDASKNAWQLIAAIGSLEFLPHLPDLLGRIYHKLLLPGGCFVFTYEPLISGYSGQDQRVTTEKTGAAFGHGTITTFRYRPQSVTKVLLKQKAIIKADEEFVAYRKAERAVIYRLVVIKKQP